MSVTTYSNLSTDPDVPSTGDVKFYMKDKAPAWRDDTGAVNKLETPVFGSHFCTQKRTDEVTNSTDSFVTYITQINPDCVAGKYRVGVEMTWGMNTTSRNFLGAVFVNGTQELGFEMEAKDSGTDIRNQNSGFVYHDITVTEDCTIEVKFKPENSGYIAYCYGATVECWRVS